MTQLDEIKETLRKTLSGTGGDSISVKYRDPKKEETLIVTLHDYVDDD